MNNNLTELVCLLDSSGSMCHLVNDTIGGYNAFIEKQKEVEGVCKVTLIDFNNRSKTIYENKDVKEVGKLTSDTYRAHGGTSLLDTIGATIDSVGKRLKETPEDERPAKVLFVIITDGEDTTSSDPKYTEEGAIKRMIEHQEEKYNWEFNFLGANIDATSVGTTYGIKAANTMNFSANSRGIDMSMNVLAAKTTAYRSNVSYSVKSQEDITL